MGSPIKYYRVPEVSRTCCVNVVDSMIKEEDLLRYSSFLLLEFFKNSIRIKFEQDAKERWQLL